MAEEERRDVQLLVGGGVVKEGLVARAVIEDDRERAVLLRIALFLGKLDISALDERDLAAEIPAVHLRRRTEAAVHDGIAAGERRGIKIIEHIWERTLLFAVERGAQLPDHARGIIPGGDLNGVLAQAGLGDGAGVDHAAVVWVRLRVGGLLIGCISAVARGGHDDHARLAGGLDGLLLAVFTVVEASAQADAQVDDIRAERHGVFDGGDDVSLACRDIRRVGKNLHGKQLALRRRAAHAVVSVDLGLALAVRADDTGNVHTVVIGGILHGGIDDAAVLIGVVIAVRNLFGKIAALELGVARLDGTHVLLAELARNAR